jgi:SAM-dependent methyltransferase
MTEHKLATYLNLCTQVYDLSKPVPPDDAYAFYRDYVANAPGLIIEPMCGTGRFLLPLLEEGFTVQGFDASEHMLAALHAKAKRHHLELDVWHSFLENWVTSARYDLIFIPSSSFCLLTNQAAIKSVLKLFFQHLTEAGILLFEAETFNSITSFGIWHGAKWDCPDGKMILLSKYAALDGNICSMIGKYELVDNHQIIHSEIEELKVRLYDQKELIGLLHEAGFSQVRAIKAFDKNSIPDEQDESVVYECKK